MNKIFSLKIYKGLKMITMIRKLGIVQKVLLKIDVKVRSQPKFCKISLKNDIKIGSMPKLYTFTQLYNFVITILYFRF